MSEKDNPGVTTTSPVQQNMIPKERLDELIARERAANEQVQVLQQILRSVVPSQQAQPKQEPEYLVRLKEENPAAYAALTSQAHQLAQQSQALFVFGDKQDQLQFIQDFGDEGKKYLPQVEAELQKLRANGRSDFNRGQIFLHIKGIESLQKPSQPAAATVVAAPTETVNNTPNNVPSSDPASAVTTAKGSATAVSTKETLAEKEERLKDFTF